MLKAAVMRRHLTDDQRAMIAAKWAQENKQTAGRPEKNAGQRSPLLNHPVRETAQEMFGVSERKVKEATTALLNQPELAEEVKRGDTTMREVSRDDVSRDTVYYCSCLSCAGSRSSSDRIYGECLCPRWIR
jgi:hypothetical protein